MFNIHLVENTTVALWVAFTKLYQGADYTTEPLFSPQLIISVPLKIRRFNFELSRCPSLLLKLYGSYWSAW
jgi:hypothetical protein